MDNPTTRWIVLVLLNAPLYFAMGWVLFRTWSDFFECVGYYFTPDWYSWIRGELMEDWWGSLKVVLFVAICTASVYGEHRLFFEAKAKQPTVSSEPAPLP
jgi:ABC-type spermidine/putrescine transport system permease subunit II